MAISRKPKPMASDSAAVDIEALIHKGGSVAGEGSPQGGNKRKRVMLRLPLAMLEKVDAALSTRPLDTARTTWIMEAIVEKLEREGE